MNNQEAQKYNLIRKHCLENAQDLLKASKLALDGKIDHVSFHLSALALEEVGKTHLLFAEKEEAEMPIRDETNFDTTAHTHEKKLFWAIWWSAFSKKKLTKKDIDDMQGLARSIHDRRLAYLYTDPEDPISWREKMEEGEAQMIYDFANAKYLLESNLEGAREDLTEEEKEDLKWFYEATNDPERRKEVLGSKSQDKLIELDGDVKKWIQWMKEIYQKQLEEMRKIVEEEMSRPKPEGKTEEEKPKWKVRVKIITPSHAIQNKHLSEFNRNSSHIKLFRGKDANTLLIDFTFPRAMQALAIWDMGWGFVRAFVIALNIGSRGHFWWNVPLDLDKFYESIEDLDRKDHKLEIRQGPRLSMDWKSQRLVLKKEDLSLIGVIYNYVLKRFNKKTGPLNHYLGGVAFLSKSDIHLRFELNAIELFFKALKGAMVEGEFWDGKSDLKEALHNKLKPYLSKFDEIDRIVDAAQQIEQTHQTTAKLTLTEVIAMKMYCDFIFLELVAKEVAKDGINISIKTGDPSNQ